jgi:hypothetical protein
VTAAHTVTEETRVRRARRTAARTIGGRSVVVVIDSQAMHTLSEVGTLVFERADGASVAALVDIVVDEFDVDRETAFADVRAFVEELLALGAFEVVS